MPAIFKTVPWQVEQLVSSVASGAVQLPDLQRPFVWPATKVRDLFDSMYRGYPVGMLMFWDVPAHGETHSIAAGAMLSATHQIIDGQQRLTSLYAAMKGHPVHDEAYRERTITISFNPFSEKFEVRTPALARSTQWVEDISTCFTSPIKAAKAFLTRLAASGTAVSDDEEDRLQNVFIKLSDLSKYQFDVVHIQQDADKRLVADIFVRINSEGVRLKAYDYILTWLSVFWPEGREAVEAFARNSRISPQRATEIAGHRVDWTALNPYIAVENGHLVRAMVAFGQGRGRLQDAYAALQAKDRATGFVDPDRQEAELDKLKWALPIVTNPTNWTEYVHAIQTAGFRSYKNITSNMNLVYSYVIFLMGRTHYKVELAALRRVIARWLFTAQLTGRYTGSAESQIQKDLDRISGVAPGDGDGFLRLLNEIIDSQVTADFWQYGMPQQLVTSGPGLSPHYQCYLAALNILDAEMFMLEDPRVRQWMDPSLPAVKGMEGHHLFPRAYQEKVLGTTDIKRINQAANFAPTDWATNIWIDDRDPAEYWPDLVARRWRGQEWLDRQLYWHALPHGWESMEYEDFLAARRSLMAQVTRDAFVKLSGGQAEALQPAAAIQDVLEEPTLQYLVESGLLVAGDLLDPVDPEWEVDAVIADDGTLVIDGTETFDSLDEAAHHLNVTNMSGFTFWALETQDDLVPLADLLAAGRPTT